jgi:chromosome segregation and condensation protein ScpB
MILRNLMLRGLVEEKEDTRLGQPIYAVTLDFLRHIGMASAEELPMYEELRGHQHVVDILNDLQEASAKSEDQASGSEGGAGDKETLVV